MIVPLNIEEPTIENICSSIKNNRYHRSQTSFRLLDAIHEAQFIGSSSIALDGRWGSGKTFILRQIYYALKHDPVYSDVFKEAASTHIEDYDASMTKSETSLFPDIYPVYYDAWINDNELDPLISIMATICQDLNFESDTEIRTRLSKMLDAFSLNIGPVSLQPSALINGMLGKNDINELLDKRKQKENISEILSAIIDNLASHRSTASVKKLLIIVDELDRCRPEFAAKLLERVKHYFDIENVIFLFGTNIYALSSLLQQQYGPAFPCSAYLNRFFDIRVTLPPISSREFLNSNNIDNSFILNYCDLNSRFKVLAWISESYNLSIRDMLQVFNEIQFFKSYGYDLDEQIASQFIVVFLIPLLLILRRHDLDRFGEFINGNDKGPLEMLHKSDRSGYIFNCLYRHSASPSLDVQNGQISAIYDFLFSRSSRKNNDYLDVGNAKFNTNHRSLIHERFYEVIPIFPK